MSNAPAAAAIQAGSTLTDEQVVDRVRAGDVALFEILMRRHNQRLYRVIRSIIADEAEVEDVMQQAYVNAFEHLHQFESRARFSTWLTRIAVYEALARVRRRTKMRQAPWDEDAEGAETMAPPSPRPNPEQDALGGELSRLLEGAIDALPPSYRSVFVMREIESMSTADTASTLDLSEDTVKTRLHRARTMLQQQLYDRAGLTHANLFAFHATRCDRVVAAVFPRLGITR
jgi:RNA polymerase sigma-70 factor (ECF subfamily)